MKKNTLALLTTLVLSFLLLILIFRPVLQHPQHIVFSPRGDALKSYYNFSWYIKYDSGIRHDAINYPYGEHLQYINTHPLYVQIVKFLDRHITPVADYGIAILNLSMVFSLLAAVPFLFLILRYFSMPAWYSALITLIILFLTPQLDRIGGHFEMVYAFFIPLYWYLLLRWNEGRKPWIWGILLVATALVGGFTSAYYVAFFLVFSLALLIVQAIQHRDDLRTYLRKGSGLLMIAVLPVIMVKGLVLLTDWASDRPDNPWGFFIFHSNLWSIFLPRNSLLRELLGHPAYMNYSWEGRAYVGLPGTMLALSVGWYMLISLLRWRKPDLRMFFRDRRLNTWLLAAAIVLLFAMAIPFEWGLQFIVDLIPQLKQFRCLGRFSWIFYYVFTVFTASFLYTFYRRMRLKKMQVLGSLVLVVALGFWILDAGMNVKKSTAKIFNENHFLLPGDTEVLEKFEQTGREPGEFQAILALPFTNTSGDKLMHPGGEEAFAEAMKYSYNSRIPLIQAYSPRLPFSDALSTIQLLADTSIYKIRPEDMSDKPVLLLMTRQELEGQERWLKDQADVFYEDDEISLASLPVQSFNNGHAEWVARSRSTADTMTCPERVCSDRQGIYYESFDDEDSDRVFTGPGALYRKRGEIEIFRRELYSIGKGKPLKLSFWLYFDERMWGMPEADIYMLDEQGRRVQRTKIMTRETHNVFRDWVRVSIPFEPEPGAEYQFILKGRLMTMDDLLICPYDATVFVKAEADFDLFNNYPLIR
jgi:hypothetical protein